MIEQLLPPSVATAEQIGPAGREVPSEQTDALGSVSDKRWHEFLAGRACARRAMAQLGYFDVPLPRGSNGDPQWPAGLIGSITHCTDYCAAAVVLTADLIGIGIDAEPHRETRGRVVHVIAREEELAQLAELKLQYPQIHWDRLLFSAKEAVFKAWFPLARRWLGFRDVSVELEVTTRTFTARLLTADVPSPLLAPMSGRWMCTDLILTCVTLPAS